MGQSLAALHTAGNGLGSTYHRHDLDLAWLLDASMQVIDQHLTGTDALAALQRAARHVSSKLQTIDLSRLDYGLCHGDFHGGNLHVDKDRVTLFDFEECALGYRVYDLATFKWDLGYHPAAQSQWDAFFDGYGAKRKVQAEDASVIDAFVVLRELAELSYGIRNIIYFGHNDILASDSTAVIRRINRMLDTL